MKTTDLLYQQNNPVKPEKNIPVKPDKNPDPTIPNKVEINPEKNDPTRIDEPPFPHPDPDKQIPQKTMEITFSGGLKAYNFL